MMSDEENPRLPFIFNHMNFEVSLSFVQFIVCPGTLKLGVEPLSYHSELHPASPIPDPYLRVRVRVRVTLPVTPKGIKRSRKTSGALFIVELTRPSGPALPRSDILHLVPDLRQAKLYLTQLEVERELLVFISLPILLQGSRGLLVTLRR